MKPIPYVLNVHSWHEFLKAIMNAGYLSRDLILSGNAIFYTYALYLIAKHRFNAGYNSNMHLTSLWFFYASLTSEYAGSFESTVENHLNSIKNLNSFEEYKDFILSRVTARLTNDYFNITLLGADGLDVSGRGNNAWNAYVASLNILNAKILFSKGNLLVSTLFAPGTDGNQKSLEKHHLFPKAYLKSQGVPDNKINQMANYAFIDWKDNMDILDDAPAKWGNIMLEAEAHAVWKTPTGELLDITPHDGEDRIFFLPDDKVVYDGVRIPNHRLALTNSPLTKEYIKLGEMRDKILCSVKGKEVSLPVDLLNRMSELSVLFNTEVPRNSLCPCGSGMKYKKCCGFFS